MLYNTSLRSTIDVNINTDHSFNLAMPISAVNEAGKLLFGMSSSDEMRHLR